MSDKHVDWLISLGSKKIDLKYEYVKKKTTLIFEKRIRTYKPSKNATRSYNMINKCSSDIKILQTT